MHTDYFNDFSQENSSFTADIMPEDTDGRLFGLMYDYQFRGRPIYNHFSNYYIVWKRGIAGTRIIDYRFGTIRRKADEETLPFYNDWLLPSKKYKDQYTNMEYLLARGTPTSEHHLLNFEQSKSVDKWSLYERK